MRTFGILRQHPRGARGISIVEANRGGCLELAFLRGKRYHYGNDSIRLRVGADDDLAREEGGALKNLPEAIQQVSMPLLPSLFVGGVIAALIAPPGDLVRFIRVF